MTEPPHPGLPGAVPLPPADPPAAGTSSSAVTPPPPPPGVPSDAVPPSSSAATLLPPPPPPGVAAAARTSVAGPSGALATPSPDGDRDAPVGSRARDDRGLLGIAALAVLVVAIVVVNAALLLRGPQRSGPGTGARPAAGMPWRTPAISPKPSTTPRPSRSPRPSPTARPTASPSAEPAASASAAATPVPTTRPLGNEPELRIGVSIPRGGPDDALAQGILEGVELAIQEVAVPGRRVQAEVIDYQGSDYVDLGLARQGMKGLVASPTVVGVVGPLHTDVARIQAPVANAAGLAMCGPATSDTGLTKGWQGENLRLDHPDRLTFVRVVTPADLQGIALARFAYQTLHARRAVVLDDWDAGVPAADGFRAEFRRLGGKVIDRLSVYASDRYELRIERWTAAKVDVVMFGGSTLSGVPGLSRSLRNSPLSDVPLLVPDLVADGDASVDGSFAHVTGRAGVATYAATGSIGDYPGRAAFAKRYAAAFGHEPGAYSAPAYACAQVLLQAIRTAAAGGQLTREAVRAAATDPRTTFTTVLGPVRFDAVGDRRMHSVAISRLAPGPSGVLDWRFERQVTWGK